MAEDTLTITDNRTGETYEVPISYGTFPDYGAAIPAADLRKIKASDDDFGLIQAGARGSALTWEPKRIRARSLLSMT